MLTPQQIMYRKISAKTSYRNGFIDEQKYKAIIQHLDKLEEQIKRKHDIKLNKVKARLMQEMS